MLPKKRLTLQASSSQITPGKKEARHEEQFKPVTFRYKEELDPDGNPQFGLIAEEVEKVNPDRVVREEDGKLNTVRYEAVNAMLLNEFLKEHRKVEEQAAKLEQQQKQIEALTTSVQKVSDQLRLNSSVPQLIVPGQ